MSGGIKKIDSITNMAVFHNFKWEKSFSNESNSVVGFSTINILYGRNYSGKTTLSRILRAMETGELSDKFENPSFNVALDDGKQITQTTLTNHDKKIRVFNEDFIRDNLRFITNPNDSIESFAILGDDNNKIEKEIEELESELGVSEEGNQTGLYAEKIEATSLFEKTSQEYNKANDHFDITPPLRGSRQGKDGVRRRAGGGWTGEGEIGRRRTRQAQHICRDPFPSRGERISEASMQALCNTSVIPACFKQESRIRWAGSEARSDPPPHQPSPDGSASATPPQGESG